MSTRYLYDANGFYAGTCEGVASHPNSTDIPPPAGEARPQFVDGSWVQSTSPSRVSPIQFKLLFTVAERVAIKESTDPLVMDFFGIANDPRLTFVDLSLASTRQALIYLAEKKLIGQERPAQILTGIVQ